MLQPVIREAVSGCCNRAEKACSYRGKLQEILRAESLSHSLPQPTLLTPWEASIRYVRERRFLPGLVEDFTAF